jgi:hypothetical protein
VFYWTLEGHLDGCTRHRMHAHAHALGHAHMYMRMCRHMAHGSEDTCPSCVSISPQSGLTRAVASALASALGALISVRVQPTSSSPTRTSICIRSHLGPARSSSVHQCTHRSSPRARRPSRRPGQNHRSQPQHHHRGFCMKCLAQKSLAQAVRQALALAARRALALAARRWGEGVLLEFPCL